MYLLRDLAFLREEAELRFTPSFSMNIGLSERDNII